MPNDDELELERIFTSNDIRNDDDSYCSKFFTPDLTERLEAAAFRSLKAHLHDRSDVVSNMDLMTISGFCRNCLAKWMVLAARDLADELDLQKSAGTTDIAALDSFGYDEAAEHVYGMRYDQWKQLFQREATAEEMKRYTESRTIHAQHDKSRLEQLWRAASGPSTEIRGRRELVTTTTTASNVCCEPTPLPKARATSSGVRVPFTYSGSLKFGVLTVSDRAARGAYETGDLSGPAVVETLRSLLLVSSNRNSIASVQVVVVADDKEDIQSQLLTWCDNDDDGDKVDVILTTGGTGLARRDVTPEATIEILDAEWRSVMALSSRANVLSRGTAGFRNNTVIANLPGNPQAAREILPELLPIIWNAALELQQDAKES